MNMLKYKNIFTKRNLSHLMRPHDSRRYKINIRKDRDSLLKEALDIAFSSSTDFSSDVFSSTVNGKNCYSIKNYSKVLIIRAITEYIHNIFAIKPPSRDKIVRGVIETLCDSTPMYIIKKDIKSFYENIEIASLKNLIFKQQLLPYHTRILLKTFFSQFCSDSNGIPRGLGLSAALSEVFLLGFDKQVMRIKGVYRYFRYVDDVLIFCSKQSSLATIDSELNKHLSPGLSFNLEKSIPPIAINCIKNKINNPTNRSFDYLGYEFGFDDIVGQKRPRKIVISIAQKKIKKIKTKIVLSIKNFAKNRDEKLLLNRMQFISSNYLVRRRGNEKIQRSKFVKSGIFYNYCLCGVYEGKDHASPQFSDPHLSELIKLDNFYQTLIGKNSKFKSITSTIPAATLWEMKKISFKKGYEKRMIVKFKENRVKEIKRGWRNAY